MSHPRAIHEPPTMDRQCEETFWVTNQGGRGLRLQCEERVTRAGHRTHHAHAVIAGRSVELRWKVKNDG
jgi:hypothetical protein